MKRLRNRKEVELAVLDFKADDRIKPEYRRELRAFASEAGQSVKALAERLGMSVWLVDLPEGVAAVLVKSRAMDKSDHFRILVNKNDTAERQRFSIAHEIGHFVLHRNDPDFCVLEEEEFSADIVPLFAGKANSFRDSLSSYGVSRLEKEANRFASLLLLPTNLLRRDAAYRNGHHATVARRFQVPFAVAHRRIKEMESRKL